MGQVRGNRHYSYVGRGHGFPVAARRYGATHRSHRPRRVRIYDGPARIAERHHQTNERQIRLADRIRLDHLAAGPGQRIAPVLPDRRRRNRRDHNVQPGLSAVLYRLDANPEARIDPANQTKRPLHLRPRGLQKRDNSKNQIAIALQPAQPGRPRLRPRRTGRDYEYLPGKQHQNLLRRDTLRPDPRRQTTHPDSNPLRRSIG